MKKRSLVLLTAFLSVLASACSASTGEKIDYSRTQLYVSNFNGGYGDAWLKDLKIGFEARHAETSFEEGKKGVQVIIDNNQTQGVHLLSQVSGSNNNVFFAESVFYYEWLDAGLMADLSDVVNADLTPYGDTGTILDKFSDLQEDYYTTDDGKIYAIPHYEGFYGLTYDLKLWRDKKLYIAADPDKADQKVNALYDGDEIALCRTATQVKSNGPDGVPNTYDDGFPATYKELADLMFIMGKKGITPFTWSGKYQREYNSKLLAALVADYEGAEGTELLINLDGTSDHLISGFDKDGNPVFDEPTTINSRNGYETFRSAGFYYALKFMEQIVNNSKYYSERSFIGTEDHLAAQQTYLLSYPEEALGSNPIAILPEGNYWENEAYKSGTFDFAETYGTEFSRENREIAMMPMPKATEEQVGQQTTLLGMLQSVCFINANCDDLHMQIAKDFLIFANTNDALANFQLTTNAPKQLKYTLTPEQYETLNCFGKSVYDIVQGSVIVPEISTNNIIINNQQTFGLGNRFDSKIGNAVYNNPVKEMCPKQTTTYRTALELFLGISKNFNSSWYNQFSKWF